LIGWLPTTTSAVARARITRGHSDETISEIAAA
jgi:hypothetical protein